MLTADVHTHLWTASPGEVGHTSSCKNKGAHTHRQWAYCFSYYREIRLIKKQLPSPRHFSVLFTTCSLITYADVSRAILATWINELYVVQRNLCNRSHLSAHILQHKARGQSTAVQLPLLAALAILANGQLNQPYGSGDFHLSPPSLVIQSSRQWPVVHFRLCGTILGAARMTPACRDELFLSYLQPQRQPMTGPFSLAKISWFEGHSLMYELDSTLY